MADTMDQQDGPIADMFEPMPLHKIEAFTLDQLVEEHQFAAKAMAVDDPRRNIYLQMISAIARFQFPGADWDDALLDFMMAKSIDQPPAVAKLN